MTFKDRRASPREDLRLPIRWHDRQGWTRDISPDGAYVSLPGSLIPVRWCALEVGSTEARLRFRTLAEVMRVEPGPGTTGLALRFHAQVLHSRE